jgi:hypothetical protein
MENQKNIKRVERSKLRLVVGNYFLSGVQGKLSGMGWLLLLAGIIFGRLGSFVFKGILEIDISSGLLLAAIVLLGLSLLFKQFYTEEAIQGKGNNVKRQRKYLQELMITTMNRLEKIASKKLGKICLSPFNSDFRDQAPLITSTAFINTLKIIVKIDRQLLVLAKKHHRLYFKVSDEEAPKKDFFFDEALKIINQGMAESKESRQIFAEVEDAFNKLINRHILSEEEIIQLIRDRR